MNLCTIYFPRTSAYGHEVRVMSENLQPSMPFPISSETAYGTPGTSTLL
jgi:hypothetical protein